jgi:hypothetical protein
MTVDLTPIWSFGYRELERQETSSHKCRNVEMQNTKILEIVTWSVKTLHQRNVETSK